MKALPHDLRDAPFAIQRAYVEGYNAATQKGSTEPDAAGRKYILEVLPKIIRLRSYKKSTKA